MHENDAHLAESLEPILGYQFRNRALLASACSISTRAFGPLEHLGDAIADLSIGMACWAAGLGAEDASHLVANATLDEVYTRHFKGLVNARSGDVVEAFVGAVHLDGGFTVASSVAVHLCGDGLAPCDVPDVDLESLLMAGSPSPELTWLGALALDAVVAHRHVADRGIKATTQRELTMARAQLTSIRALARCATRCGVSGIDDQDAANRFRSVVAATLLGAGWNTAERLTWRALRPTEDVPIRSGPRRPA
jgi:hypothetical protein